MRVTARLDEQRSRDLKRLQALTRLSVEEILNRGIDLVAQQQADQRCEQPAAIASSRFVGCLQDAPEDLASDYRRYLAEIMREEHGVG